MCFVCHMLIYRDAEDMDMATLSDTVKDLQRDLSVHLANSHKIQLTTGVNTCDVDSLSEDPISKCMQWNE